MHEAQSARVRGGKRLSGQEVAAGCSGADGRENVRADRRGDEADPYLRDREHRLFGGDRDITRCHQPDARGVGRAIDLGYGRLWQLIERAQHRADRFCARQILCFTTNRHAAHPVEIGAGRKRDVTAGENNDARFAVCAKRLERVGQRTDHSVVDRIAHPRPVDRDGGNAARVLGDDNRGFAHLSASAIADSQRMEFSRLHYFLQLANRHEAALKLVLCETRIQTRGLRLGLRRCPGSRVGRSPMSHNRHGHRM